jgi:ubiquinol-cytochrome c reductase cytochrome b subunit
MAIVILAILPFKKTKRRKFSPKRKINFWFLTRTFIILTWIGANPVEPPYESIGQITRILYFTRILTM